MAVAFVGERWGYTSGSYYAWFIVTAIQRDPSISRAWRVLWRDLPSMSESCSGNACEKKQREWQPTVRNKVTCGAAWARGVFAKRRARKPPSERNGQGD